MGIVTGNIEKEFVVHTPGKDAFLEVKDEGLYERIGRDYNGFAGHDLIAAHEFTSDWPTWEVHPHGDEIVLLLSGELTFLLKLATGEQSVTLDEPGRYVVVPRGIWHTAKVSVKSKLLFITPGEGTLNSDTPDDPA